MKNTFYKGGFYILAVLLFGSGCLKNSSLNQSPNDLRNEPESGEAGSGSRPGPRGAFSLKEIWTREIKGENPTAFRIAGDRIFVVSREGSLWALNEAQGSVEWKKKLDGTISYAPEWDGKVLYVSAGQRTFAIDPGGKGRILAVYEDSAGVTAPLGIFDRYLIQAGAKGTLNGLSRPELQLIWSLKMNDWMISPVAFSGEHAFFVTRGGKLCQVRTESRDDDDRLTLELPGTAYTPVSVFRNALTVGVWNVGLMGFSLSEERLQPAGLDEKGGAVYEPSWTLPEFGHVRRGMGLDGEHLIAADFSGLVARIDPVRGKILWRRKLNDRLEADLSVKDRTVFVGGARGGLWALDAETGDTEWNGKWSAGVTYGPTALEDGMAFIDSSSRLVRFAPEKDHETPH